jgi:hypothetical protein
MRASATWSKLTSDGTGGQQYGDLRAVWKKAALAAELSMETLFDLQKAIEKQEAQQ